jgi:hypothetical protein
MMEILLPEQQDFGNWHMSHPYYKGFHEVVEIVRRRTRESDGKFKESGDNDNRSIRGV